MAESFLNGDPKELYRRGLGENWVKTYDADRLTVIKSLTSVLHIPDYFIHRQLRDMLRKDGFLDFEWHKKSIEASIDAIANDPNVKDYTGKLPASVVKMLTDLVPQAPDTLKASFLATIPVYNDGAYARIESKRKEAIKGAQETRSTLKNLEEALASNDIPKLIHQGTKAYGQYKDVLAKLIDIQNEALTDAKVRVGDRYKPIYTDQKSTTPIYVFDYIAKEWDALKLGEWGDVIKAKIAKIKR